MGTGAAFMVRGAKAKAGQIAADVTDIETIQTLTDWRYGSQDVSPEAIGKAGLAYIIAQGILVLIPLVGAYWYLLYMVKKDSEKTRAKLIWAINNLILYNILVIICHFAILG